MSATRAGIIRVISRTEKSIDIEWWIDKFFETFRESDIWSPYISFANGEWYFNVEDPVRLPNPINKSVMFVLQRFPEERRSVHYWLGVRLPGGGEETIMDERPATEDVCSWLQSSDLKKREQVLAPSGTMKILLRMRTEQEIENAAKSPRSHIENISERKYNQTAIEDIVILQKHFKNLLHTGEDHDVVFRVKSKEFRAHKTVLQARSPVFKRMLQECAVISVDDCDPDCFEEFLQYVYTGKIEDISPTNVFGLQCASEKFGFPALREKCRERLEYLISILMVSDDGEQYESSMAFFTKHLENIMETVEWEQFLVGDPVKANKLTLKALQRRH